MIIHKFNFPIYGTFILLSLLIGIVFNYIYLRKNEVESKRIILFSLMLFMYSIFGGVLLTAIVSRDFNTIGLSSYGGAIGLIVAALVFEKMCDSKGTYIKGAILSLPLIYSVAKLACFFAGCCYGIPYDGIGSVTYPDGLNIPLFPVQLAETIVFLGVFIVCVLNSKNRNIIEITLILCAVSKGLLDFLRYSHLEETVSVNQWISIVFAIVATVFIIKREVEAR